MTIPINIFFNGPPGAGKTALAEYFAKQSKAGADIDIDRIRHLQKGGICRTSNEQAFFDQKRLAYINTRCLINNFREHEVETFVADTILDPKIVIAYQDELGNLENSYHFLLLPNIEVAKERNKKREQYKIMEDDVIGKYFRFASETTLPLNWIVIDNSNQTIEETAEIIRTKIVDNSH